LNTYNKILRCNIRLAKRHYYENCFKKFKNDIRQTWSVIKDVINKTGKSSDFPMYFTLNNVNLSNPMTIANAFNKYFVNIGPKLASNLTPIENRSFQDYLTNPVNHSFQFQRINESAVIEIIDKLQNKTSSGFDGLSNKLLKLIKYEVVKPLTFIINQTLCTGIFPSKLKLAKVFFFF